MTALRKLSIQRSELRTGPKLGLAPPSLTLPASATDAGCGRIVIFDWSCMVHLHGPSPLRMIVPRGMIQGVCRNYFAAQCDVAHAGASCVHRR
jgi:hypothetical protein